MVDEHILRLSWVAYEGSSIVWRRGSGQSDVIISEINRKSNLFLSYGDWGWRCRWLRNPSVPVELIKNLLALLNSKVSGDEVEDFVLEAFTSDLGVVVVHEPRFDEGLHLILTNEVFHEDHECE